jgi:hypothetical protein
MISTWLDDQDFPTYDESDFPELAQQLKELRTKWIYEFDTVENRKMMKKEFHDLVIPYLRDKKIDYLLEDDKLYRK